MTGRRRDPDPALPAEPPEPSPASDPAADPVAHPSARDLVRGHRRAGRVPDTGRRHHIGSAPEVVPLHTPTGVELTRVTAWQLADRTPAQLAAQRTATAERMRRAAEELDFETAARRRDDLAAVEAELSRRAAPADPAEPPAAQPPGQHAPGQNPPDGPPTSAGSAG